MAQPTRYSPSYNFTSFQAANPDTPLPADKADEQFSALQATTDGLISNLAIIQRDDGQLANQAVKPETLSADVLNLIGGFNPRGAWLTGTVYAAKDLVSFSGGSYVSVTGHTAGVFATDLAAGKWLLLASTGSATAAFFQPTGSAIPDIGMYLPAAGVMGFSSGGADALRVTTPAGGGDYALINGGAATGNPSSPGKVRLSAQGSDATIDLELNAKGTFGLIRALCGIATIGNMAATGSVSAAASIIGASAAGAMMAAKTDMQNPTRTDMVVSPAAVRYHPGVCKAWVLFNGTGAIAIAGAYNVSSLIDSGVGNYGVVYINPFADQAYATLFTSADNGGGAGNVAFLPASSRVVGSVGVLTVTSSTIALCDSSSVNVACFGTLLT